MRRGTVPAEVFGNCVFVIRTKHTKVSMNTLGRKMNKPAASISQIEKGIRALKEPNIKEYANALDVHETDLRNLWHACQGVYERRLEEEPKVEKDQHKIKQRIHRLLRYMVPEYDYGLAIPDIEPIGPIVRVRTKSKNIDVIRDKFSELTAPERMRVLGYIDALIDNRSKT